MLGLDRGGGWRGVVTIWINMSAVYSCSLSFSPLLWLPSTFPLSTGSSLSRIQTTPAFEFSLYPYALSVFPFFICPFIYHIPLLACTSFSLLLYLIFLPPPPFTYHSSLLAPPSPPLMTTPHLANLFFSFWITVVIISHHLVLLSLSLTHWDSQSPVSLLASTRFLSKAGVYSCAFPIRHCCPLTKRHILFSSSVSPPLLVQFYNFISKNRRVSSL